MFRSLGTGSFLCVGCGHLLVSQFDPRSLIALDIQCYKCATISRTPPWPGNEPLPMQLVTIGKTGAYLIKGTVVTGHGAMTCDEEIERVSALIGIRPVRRETFDFSEASLDAVEAKMNVICPSFATCLARTKVAEARRNFQFMKFPPAWALQQLRRVVQARRFDPRGADGLAFTYLQMTISTLDRWAHHPLFESIAHSVLFEFHHSIAQLIAASYLADHGNRIGFSEPSKAGGRTPDLFVNLDAGSKLGLEVKAPAEWQWPNTLPSDARIARVVEEKAKQSRGQIANSGGILVLGAFIPDPRFGERVQAVVEALCGTNRVPSRIAAVALVNLAPHPDVTAGAPGVALLQSEARVTPILNPRYSGVNPIQTQ